MDPWSRLREHTQARIGLGRAGDALPTKALLEFQLGHAKARDAVHGLADFDRIASELAPQEAVHVSSQAKDRAEYLLRPDLGRQLAQHTLVRGEYDLALVIADGLSATAVNRHSVGVAKSLLQRLSQWKIAPIVLVSNGRVAIGDDIGQALGAQVVAVLIGERPGLTVSDSLGIYITHAPRPGRADSERNCISNVHANGLSVETAAQKAEWLLSQSRKLGYSGIALKENAGGLVSS